MRQPISHHHQRKLTVLASSFRKGGWEAVALIIHANALDASQVRAQLFEYFLSADEVELAWQTIEGRVDSLGDFSSGLKLAAAKAALLTGPADTARELLESAIEGGLNGPEEIRGAQMLAEEMEMYATADGLIDQLVSDHPTSELIEEALFLQHFRRKEYGQALAIALSTGNLLQAALCRAFASPRLDPTELFDEARKAGRLEQSLLTCAEEALLRKRLCHASHWAGQVPAGHPLFEPACLLRLTVLRHAFRGPVHRFFIDELQRVMSVVALNPSDTTLRIACERLLDHTLEEPLVIRLLSVTALTLLEQQARRDGQSVELSRSIQARFDDSAGAQTEEEIADYVNGITDAQIRLTPGRIIIGEGTLPESLRPLAGMRVVRFLAELITSPEGRADLAGSVTLLHALCLTCKEIGDPSSDYSTAQSWIDYHGSMGASQEARNLGEHCLQMWPQAQTPFTEWRISQGWATLCEACLRSHHIVAALRYLCLSLLAHREPAPDVELLRRSYRRAARIFRDLRAIPFVDECVAAEASLLSRIGDPAGPVHDLEVFRFLVEFRFALGGSPEERLELLLRSEELLRAGVPSTLPPLISAQASILRLLPAERVPADLRAAFLERTAALPEAMRRMLEVTAAGRPTREQLVQLITTLPDAEDYGYLASQIEPILPAVANALHLAVETGDPELFLLASGPFSQPVLGVQVKEARVPSPRRQSTSRLRSVPLEKLRAGVFEEDERYSFAAMAQVSMRGLQDCLLDGEAILVICGEPGDAPSMMVATRGQPVAIRPVSSWSAAAFSRWRQGYKDALYWAEPKGYLPGIDSLLPPVSGIRALFRALSLGLEEVPGYLTIIPAAPLFGFTWQLSPLGSQFLAERTRVAVAPSAFWLIEARSSSPAAGRGCNAWIGSPRSNNDTLIGLRAMVADCLEAADFHMSAQDVPTDLAGSNMAFVGAHGGTGVGDHFRSISDDVNSFTPREFARMLRGCRCVVLAVCSAGRSDRQTGNEETTGLVTELLREGVRCVVAPPWPLDIHVVRAWLPAFLAGMRAGERAGEAARQALQAVRAAINHPCAWAQLHVYGDQATTL